MGATLLHSDNNHAHYLKCFQLMGIIPTPLAQYSGSLTARPTGLFSKTFYTFCFLYSNYVTEFGLYPIDNNVEVLGSN